MLQEYSTDALQLDIYEKLSNLQVELKKLQDAEQLLSNALSTKYLDLQQWGQCDKINVAINIETCHHNPIIALQSTNYVFREDDF